MNKEELLTSEELEALLSDEDSGAPPDSPAPSSAPLAVAEAESGEAVMLERIRELGQAVASLTQRVQALEQEMKEQRAAMAAELVAASQALDTEGKRDSEPKPPEDVPITQSRSERHKVVRKGWFK